MKNKPNTSIKDFGQPAGADMGRVKTTASGQAKPQPAGADTRGEQSCGKPETGEMGKVKNVANR